MIPRIIHYCWFGRNPKPQSVLMYIQTWKKQMPDYKIKEWNEDNFDINMMAYTKEAYHARKYAFVSDIARLYALVKEGGIYLDTDIEVIKPFDDLLNRDYFIGYEYFGNVGTGVIGCQQGSSFLLSFLDTYKERHFLLENGTFDCTPNTKLLSNFLLQNKIHLQIDPIDFYCAKNYRTGMIERSSNTYCIHHYAATWHSFYEKWEEYICKIMSIPNKHISNKIEDCCMILKCKIRHLVKKLFVFNKSSNYLFL